MEDANEKIRSVYSGLKHPERYQGRFYDAPRSFTVLMRDDASAWIKKRLQAGDVQR